MRRRRRVGGLDGAPPQNCPCSQPCISPVSCRRRIAQGSGRTEEQVSELIAMFASMRAQASGAGWLRAACVCVWGEGPPCPACMRVQRHAGGRLCAGGSPGVLTAPPRASPPPAASAADADAEPHDGAERRSAGWVWAWGRAGALCGHRPLAQCLPCGQAVLAISGRAGLLACMFPGGAAQGCTSNCDG